MSELSNKQIGKYIKLAAQLGELHNANPFKVRSLQGLAFKIERFPVALNGLPKTELYTLDGISKSGADKLSALLERGSFDDLDEYLSKTPPGIIELLQIKGIGPKKVSVLWSMGIETVGELLYACHENRLIELTGFGKKTQEQILHAIEYKKSSEGKLHYATIEHVALQLITDLKQSGFVNQCSLTGEMRRKTEIVTQLQILVSVNNETELVSFLETHPMIDNGSVRKKTVGNEKAYEAVIGNSIHLLISVIEEKKFISSLFNTTATEGHIQFLKKQSPDTILSDDVENEREIYALYKLPYFEPELREGIIEEQLLRKNEFPKLITLQDLKGCLHNHTTYSDGSNTLKEMADYCKELGFEYFGVCDHSKSAFYANGLKADRVIEQQKEIDKLNLTYTDFKILKGIESDILNDGSLDYEEDILKTFDFIVASVHSNLRMEEEKATIRLIKAIENPYTTILGHMTGRLLLARPGYEVNIEKIIDACAANNVIIELNANPYRLDMDWSYIQQAIEKGVMISINPDAHRKEGIHDMHYGVCVARKGALTKEMTFNAFGLTEIQNFLVRRNHR